MNRPQLPTTPIGWFISAVWTAVSLALARIVWVAIGLNVETYMEHKKLDKLWSGPIVDLFSAGLGWHLCGASLGIGVLIGYYSDRALARYQLKKREMAEVSRFETQIIPATGPVEIGSTNIYAWSSFSMAIQAHSQDGSRTRVPLQLWVIALWFDKPLAGYTVDVVSISGPVPVYDVRHTSPRGTMIAFDIANQTSVVRITCNPRRS